MKKLRNTAEPGAFLGSRFRFHAVAALLKHQDELHEARSLRVRLNVDDEKTEKPYCPFCRDAELRIYRRAQDDEWACCPECGFASDPVGLVSLELRCSPQEAVDYLAFQHNLYRVTKTEIDEYLYHRSCYEQFAALIQERLHVDYSLQQQYPEHGLNSASLHHLLNKLDLCQSLGGGPEIEFNLNKPDQYRYAPCQHDADDTDPRQPDTVPYWQNRPGIFQGLFGIADHMTVESWFFPNLYDELSGRIRPNASPMRLFHGPDWDLVIVIPLQDVPGHFCGVLCIGRNGNYPEDYVARLFPDFGRRTTDTGFILPTRAFRAICRSEQSGGELVAYNNPLHLIRTHLHYRDMPDLPLVGWIDDVENAPHYRTVNWSPFHSVKSKTLWMQSRQVWTIRTAIEQDAHILLYDPFRPYPNDKQTVNKFRPSWTALERMTSDAQPWPEYLDAYLKNKPPELAVEELKQITLTPKRFESCISRLPPSNPIRLLAPNTPKPFRIKIGQYEVFEEAAGIFRKTARQKNPTFVSDAKCFLDQVDRIVRSRRKIYRGRILYAGRTISFNVPATVFEKAPISTVKEIIRRAGMPEPNFCCKNRFYKAVVHGMSLLEPVEAITFVR